MKKIKFKLPKYEIEEILQLSGDQQMGWSLAAFNIPDVWNITQGEGSKIAILDSGCDLDHPDLAYNLLPGINFLNLNKLPQDDNGHGCVSPDTYVYTNFNGIEHIKSLYDKINKPETWLNDSYIKDVRDLNLKTYSLNTKTGNAEIGYIEYLHRTPVDSEVVDIALQSNINLKLTPWHPVYVKDNNGKIEKKRADELSLKDGFIFPINENAGNLNNEYVSVEGTEFKKCNNCNHICRSFNNIKSPCKKCFKRDNSIIKNTYFLNEDFCYLIGLVLTDGHLSKSKKGSYRVDITSNTYEILERAKTILSKYGFKSVIGSSKNRNCKRLMCSSKELVSILENAGILLKNKSYKQEVPSTIALSPRNCICAFIAGVIDGDGCINKSNTRNRIITISKSFADQMSFLINSIGIFCGISFVKNFGFRNNKILNEKYPIMYHITFSSVIEDIWKYLAHPVKLERSKTIVKKLKKKRKIKSISKSYYKGNFYDFTIKDYSTYFANGYAVSNTHSTGIIVAENNDIGMIGVAPKAKVIPVKVLDDKGSGDMENVVKGIRWAVDNGADIISMSLGCPRPIQNVRKAIQYAESKGIPVFCAAGNAGKTNELFYPANYKETIAVGSIDSNLMRSNFSNTGENLDFMAPGGKIFSTIPDNWYGYMSGTSMACPFVVGIAALCLSYQRKKYPNKPLFGYQGYVDILKKHVVSTMGVDTNNKHFYEGYGIIDVKALKEEFSIE